MKVAGGRIAIAPTNNLGYSGSTGRSEERSHAPIDRGSAIRTCWWGSVRRAVASTSSASAASLSTRWPYGYTAKVRWPWATNRSRLPARPAGAIRLVERPESDRRSRPAVPAQRPNAAGDPDRDSAVAQVTARWEAYLGRRRMEQRRTTPSRRQTLCRPLTQTAAITRPTPSKPRHKDCHRAFDPADLRGPWHGLRQARYTKWDVRHRGR